VEHVVGLTGIGGQGVQLAARTLAEAAMLDGHRVQMFASYGGMMRGGNSDSYVVIADRAIVAPPMPGKVDAAVIMHHAYADDLWGRLRPAGLAVVNSSVVPHEPRHEAEATLINVDALHEASNVEAPMAASLVAIGVLVAHLGLASAASLIATAERVLPSYRSDAIEANRRALQRGVDLAGDTVARAGTDG
jgi:2-oxoglutarate ferredoxin oxidoreductase subunit gamma